MPADQGEGTPLKHIHKVVEGEVAEQTMTSLVDRMEKWNANKMASKWEEGESKSNDVWV